MDDAGVYSSGLTGVRQVRMHAFEMIGTARFTGPRSLEVRLRDGGVREVIADKVCPNTGTRPALPPKPAQVTSSSSTRPISCSGPSCVACGRSRGSSCERLRVVSGSMCWGRGTSGQTEFQVNLKLGLTPPSLDPAKPVGSRTRRFDRRWRQLRGSGPSQRSGTTTTHNAIPVCPARHGVLGGKTSGRYPARSPS